MTESPGFIAELVALLGKEGVLCSRTDLRAYGYDASLERGLPEAIAFPASTEQVAAAVKLANRWEVPFLPRGSGTNLSGGTIPVRGGLILEFSRMNRTLEVDVANRRAVVEPGLLNLDLQEFLAPLGFRFAPDPSSQRISTLGGNAGENSGGPHCLRYGVTSQHVLGLEAVLPDGEVVNLGGKALDPPGYDLVGLLVGSEGTLAVITRLVLRLIPLPDATETLLAIFDTVDGASLAVSEIIARGILPACLEMMDRVVLQAVEASLKAGYPLDAGAILLVELEGAAGAVAEESEEVSQVLERQGAREIRRAREAAERELLWAGRRGAFSAVARIRPNFLVADGTVPRSRLPEVLRKVGEIGERYGLPIGNVFHAGDGNLHPLFLFDSRDPEERKRAESASREILRACVEAGGTISGEHGIGLEKVSSIELVSLPGELEVMGKVKEAFDPRGLLNPGKVLPSWNRQAREARCELNRDGQAKLAAPADENVLQKESDIFPIKLPLLSAADRNRYAVKGIIPRAVAFPRDAEEVASFLALARQEGMGVVPCGGGTALSYGSIPERVDLLLPLSRLDRVVEYDPEDLTVTAEAGLTLAGLGATLAERGQMLPLDPPCPFRATLGGTVAANLSGPLRLLYGAPRDLLLGVKVVLADGTIGRFGGKTVKNVSGYDLCKLFAGSLGTLGVIVETTFRLYPVPQMRREWLAAFDNLPQALTGLREVIDSGVELSSLEILNPFGVQRLIYKYPGFSLSEGKYLLWGKVEGRARATEEGVSRLERLCRSCGGSWQEAPSMADGDSCTAIRDFPLPQPGEILCRIGLPLSRLGDLMQEAEAIPFVSHAGCGIAFLAFSLGTEDRMEVIQRFASLATRWGGNFRVLFAPSEVEVKEKLPLLSLPLPSMDLMRRLKARFDPQGILSPGRFP